MEILSYLKTQKYLHIKQDYKKNTIQIVEIAEQFPSKAKIIEDLPENMIKNKQYEIKFKEKLQKNLYKLDKIILHLPPLDPICYSCFMFKGLFLDNHADYACADIITPLCEENPFKRRFTATNYKKLDLLTSI